MNSVALSVEDEMMAAYGVVRKGRPRSPEYSDRKLADIANRIANGQTLAQIAAACGCSTPTMAAQLKRLGLSDAQHTNVHIHSWTAGARANQRLNGVAHRKAKLLRRMSAEGRTLQEMGDATGVTRERIRQLLNKYGCAPIRKAVRHERQEQSHGKARAKSLARWYESPKGKLYLEAIPHLFAAGVTLRTQQINLYYPDIVTVTTGEGMPVHLSIPTIVDIRIDPNMPRWRLSVTAGHSSEPYIFGLPDGRRVAECALFRGGKSLCRYISLFPSKPPYDNRLNPKRQPPPPIEWTNEAVAAAWKASPEYAKLSAKREAFLNNGKLPGGRHS